MTRPRSNRLLWLAAFGLAVTLAAAVIQGCVKPSGVRAELPERIDYNWHVRPILSDSCFRCHGPDADARKARLRLDVAESAYAELPETPGAHAIVRGDADRSELIRRVTASNPDERMPPPEMHRTLSEREVAILRAWIDQGAEYQPHWAYLPPRRVEAPASAYAARAVNVIDRHVFGRLEREALSPSPEADKETLINRVTLTLTGLPPTLAEVDRFVRDTGPDAYARLVDRLLASPAYGEHMASLWMDVGRYAESDGYNDDRQNRFFWPYRDWVIGAFNRNLPFDDFVTWQIAGDLLPNRTKEQLLATAFLRLGPRTTENGAIDEEFRVEYRAERTDLIGTALLGTTVGCARCHDHKYDPISQRDYYALAAFFDQIDEPGFYPPGTTGVTAGPVLDWTDSETDSLVARAEDTLRTRDAAFRATRQAVEREAAGRAAELAAGAVEALGEPLRESLARAIVAYYPLDRTEAIRDDQVPRSMPRPALPPQLNFDVGARRPAANARQAGRRGRDSNGAPPLPPVAANLVRERLVVSPSATPGVPPAVLQSPTLRPSPHGNALFFEDDANVGFLGKRVGYFERTQPFSIDLRLLAASVYDDARVLDHRDDDNSGGGGYALHLQRNRLRFDMMHSRAGNRLRVMTKKPLAPGAWTHVTITYDGSSRAAGVAVYIDGQVAELEVHFDNLSRTILPKAAEPAFGDEFVGIGFGRRFRQSIPKGGAIDEIRLFKRALTPLEAAYLHDAGAALTRNPAALVKRVTEFLTAIDPRTTGALAALTDAREAVNRIVSVVPPLMVFEETLVTRRETFVLERGLYTELRDRVEPAAPSRLFPWDEALPRNRLGLARWLFDPGHPLTARVFVNRLWQMHLGRGLVATPGDFGAQGSTPSHPELLDDLAVAFIASGWNVKELHRTIVMSATYRAASTPSEVLLERDPENALLGRGPRRRMPAEMIRDHALAVSGLLVSSVGGPSVFPYQPAGMWDQLNGRYPAADEIPPESHYRRTLYSYVRRNGKHPGLAVFDFPDRTVCTVDRPSSTTPLQALVLMNDPQYVEAYRALARRVLDQVSGDPDTQLARVHRLALRRAPTADEAAAMRKYYDEEMARYRADPAAARRLLAVGRAPAADEATDIAQLAALTNVVTIVMNTPDAYALR